MAQYNITATSASRDMTVSNTTIDILVENEEGGRPTAGTRIQFPSPAEFDTLELAQKYANSYAGHLNDHYHEGGDDWVGQATAV
jgi:hypothetical protein